jgi:hypothetical protein
MLGLALAAVISSQPGAAATILFSDDFDAEAGAGATILNYNGFANWTVTGAVDLVASGFGGVSCPGGAGKCVDLDGSPGPGLMRSSIINFDADRIVTVKLDLSGNQRRQQVDPSNIAIAFETAQTVLDVTSFSGSQFPSLLLVSQLGISLSPAFDDPWTTYMASFRSTTAGSFRLVLSTLSADNVGPVVDNVLVTQEEPSQAVSEPAALALLGSGLLAMAGFRRRRGA